MAIVLKMHGWRKRDIASAVIIVWTFISAFRPYFDEPPHEPFMLTLVSAVFTATLLVCLLHWMVNFSERGYTRKNKKED